MKAPQRGFSLVELSVVLAVGAVAGLAAWQLLPVSKDVADGEPVQQQLSMAQASLEGFLLRNHRLPCPDIQGSGQESCTDAAGAPASAGRLPWRALGLPQGYSNLRYGVYRATTPSDNDLARVADRYQPLLPPTAPAVASSPLNGLDLCVALRRASALSGASGSELTAGGVRAAYALAHPGADGNFQGDNLTGFDLPGRAQDANYDDVVVSAGLPELSGRIGCPGRLGEANAAARAAYAAYDLDLDAGQFLRFRSMAHDVRKTSTQFAIAKEVMAGVDIVIAGAGFTTALAIAANSVGLGFGVVAKAAIPVGASAAALVAATAGVVSAVMSEAKAEAQFEGAQTLKDEYAAELVRAVNAATRADSKGLNP